jgi:hypothetical protein
MTLVDHCVVAIAKTVDCLTRWKVRVSYVISGILYHLSDARHIAKRGRANGETQVDRHCTATQVGMTVDKARHH